MSERISKRMRPNALTRLKKTRTYAAHHVPVANNSAPYPLDPCNPPTSVCFNGRILGHSGELVIFVPRVTSATCASPHLAGALFLGR
eukprot:1993074-Pyramimonas_sp.AAC.1